MKIIWNYHTNIICIVIFFKNTNNDKLKARNTYNQFYDGIKKEKKKKKNSVKTSYRKYKSLNLKYKNA